ncbi:hypothetical protein EJF36_10490 [Bacillus sp. HMF5848]|nr:hypothetical protein [Bacillus sp. HMF5848]RSK27274.1 hypothetical protein EJF36_10490 [Bacillus sp. HMF5848]
MLKKILKSIIKESMHKSHLRFSSSDHMYKKHYGHKHSRYGHSHYKKKRHSGSFFSSFFSS